MVTTILLSTEFRTIWGEKIKRPFEYAVGLMRAVNTDFVPHDHFFWRYDEMGQPLFGWRPPNGFPDMKEDLEQHHADVAAMALLQLADRLEI